jgi:hypothetical protein
MSWARISTSSSRPGRPRKKLDRFLEVEQPERQPQVLRVQHVRPVAEGMAVLVVRVDQEDAQIRPHLEHLAQDDGDAARLADARAAEQREVLAQHVLDLDAGADRGVLLQPADVDGIGAGGVVEQAQPVAAEQLDCVADDGIVGDAALEADGAALALLQLAEQVDAGRQLALGLLPAAVDVGDHADDRGSHCADRQELADGDADLTGWDGANGRVQLDARLRAADGDNLSDQLAGFGGRIWHAATL